MTRTGPEIVIQNDGTLLIDSKRLRLPNVKLLKEISRGANGVVFIGQHKFLNRTIAVKLWLKLRSGDQRNKFEQGMLEAQKAAKANGTNVLDLYDAGELSGHFYSYQEYYESTTLRRWLIANKPSLAGRFVLMTSILEAAIQLEKQGIIHGDLHSENILIGGMYDGSIYRKRESIQIDNLGHISFKIIDFGTSRFVRRRGHAPNRHWQVLEKTIDEMLYPIKMKRAYNTAHHELVYGKESATSKSERMRVYLRVLPRMLGVVRYRGETWDNPTRERDCKHLNHRAWLYLRDLMQSNQLPETQTKKLWQQSDFFD